MDHVKRMHFVGIYGVAMAALALYVRDRGIRVTGTDVQEEFPTRAMLTKARIPIDFGFRKDHIRTQHPPDLVVYTGAHGGRENPEVGEAIRRGIPVLAHGAALGKFMEGKRQISVAGSHGKTTAAAMLSAVFASSGHDPSYAVGCGEIFGLGAAGHNGRGEFFIAEADEYVTDPGHDDTPRFLWQRPEILLVTNIDFDHPDVYADLTAVQSAFRQLQEREVGQKLTVLCADDPSSRVLVGRGRNTMTYGFSPSSDVTVTHVGFGKERTFFTVSERGTEIGDFTLRLPGKHNALNAAGVIAVLRSLGISVDHIRDGLLSFHGTKRRFEKIGTIRGVTIYDDYAHHPKEIEATIAAARCWYPEKRIITVFQPHTYSRTKALLRDFATAFRQSDIALFTDIYASARETDTLGIDGHILVRETQDHHPHARYTADFTAVRTYLDTIVVPDDIIIFMGAGDIYSWGKRAMRELGKLAPVA